jgi:hypothetical protein
MDKSISGLLACSIIVSILGVPLIIIIIALAIALLFLKTIAKK